MHNSSDWIEFTLGLSREPADLTFVNVTCRAVLIFICAQVMVRLGDKRFFAKKTAFDVILGFILASTLARSINGSAPLFETIGGCFVVVLLHKLVAAWAFHSHKFGLLVKGDSECVIKDGEFIREEMQRHHVSERDILEDMRLLAHCDDYKAVARAYLERNGHISFVTKEKR